MTRGYAARFAALEEEPGFRAATAVLPRAPFEKATARAIADPGRARSQSFRIHSSSRGGVGPRPRICGYSQQGTSRYTVFGTQRVTV